MRVCWRVGGGYTPRRYFVTPHVRTVSTHNSKSKTGPCRSAGSFFIFMIVIPKFYPGQKAAIRKGNGDAYLCIRGFAFGAFITIKV